MSATGGELIAEALAARGVRFVFTLCGGHISPILVAAKARGLGVIDVRHEATAVFAADATARLTGIPGVAAVTAGPGVTNALTALENARLAPSPLVFLAGATATALKGRGALQDIDQLAVLKPAVKWSASVRRVRDLAPALDRAFGIAAEGVPGPVVVEAPLDVLYGEAVVRDWYARMTPRGGSLGNRLLRAYLARHLDRNFAGVSAAPAPRAPAPPRAPASGAVRRAAAALARAERPLLLIGTQALVRPSEAGGLAAAVTRLGVPVYLAGMARGLLGRSHPLQFRHARRAVLAEADLVILAGVPCDFRLDYGRQIGSALLVAVNLSRRELRLNRRPDIADHADPARFVRALAEHAPEGRWREWIAALAARDNGRDEEIAGAAQDRLVDPVQLCRAVDAALADDSVVVADGGDFVATASYVVRPRAPLSWLDPGPFGTLGVGAGFALAAKLCRPQAEVWALFGDGALGYGLAEFDSFVRHRVPVIAVVGNDACWAQIARAQVEVLGDDVATTLARADYHRAAEALGAKGMLVDQPAAVAQALGAAKAAAAAGIPVLVNVHLGESDFRKGAISI